MLKKLSQPAFFIIFASAASIWQWSFIHALPPFASNFNLVFIATIFILFFFDFSWAAIFALVSGFWLDSVGFGFFGLHLIVLLGIVILANQLLSAWLTNRSLYSFILLILISSLAYSLMFGAISYFSANDLQGFFLLRSYFWSGLLYQALWSIGSALIMFNLAGAATKRLKPFFLADR